MSSNRGQVQLKLVPLATSRWGAILADVDLFLSLCLAWLIVKRTLRRQSAERAARLRSIRPVSGKKCESKAYWRRNDREWTT